MLNSKENEMDYVYTILGTSVSTTVLVGILAYCSRTFLEQCLKKALIDYQHDKTLDLEKVKSEYAEMLEHKKETSKKFNEFIDLYNDSMTKVKGQLDTLIDLIPQKPCLKELDICRDEILSFKNIIHNFRLYIPNELYEYIIKLESVFSSIAARCVSSHRYFHQHNGIYFEKGNLALDEAIDIYHKDLTIIYEIDQSIKILLGVEKEN